MQTYFVEVTYDMNFSLGREMLEFQEKNDDEAKKYVEQLEDSWLSGIKRNVHVERWGRKLG